MRKCSTKVTGFIRQRKCWFCVFPPLFFLFFILHVSVSVSVCVMLGQENVDLTRKFEDSGKQGKLCEEDHKGFGILY